MLKAMSEVDTVVKVFKAVLQYPSPTSASVMNGVAGSNGITILSSWSQGSLERLKSIKFQQTHIFDSSLNKVSDTLPVDISFELLSTFSKSEELRGVVRDISFEPKKKKQHLEVWKRQKLWKTFDLSALEVHGDVYSDSDFGSFDFSPCEQKLLYIAEKKLPKTEPFYKPKPQDKGDIAAGDAKATKGEEYVFRQDWGEQLVGKHEPVVVVCDTESETVFVPVGIPAHLSPGQVTWTPDGKGIVGVAWENEPRRLGLIYCTNRQSYIFHLTADGVFNILSSEGQAVRSPRFSSNGEYLVWLQRPSGGPHHGAHKLMCCKWNSKQVETVVDIVQREAPTVGSGPFYGLFNDSLPRRCWAEDSSRLILSTPQRCTIKSYVINIENKSVTELDCPEGSQIVLDVRNDIVICARSSLKSPPSLVFGKLPSQGCEHKILWTAVTTGQSVASLDSLVCHYMTLAQEDESQASCKSFSAIYFGPESAKDHDVPFIVMPHGGPHSVYTDYFKIEAAFFAQLGFGLLMVNYRGSIGSGQESVEFLLGRIGDSDVKDVHFATCQALKQFPFLDPKKMVLMGGSHGGFLVTHLSGRFPDLFKAVVALNPVIDLPAMCAISDIPDWVAVETAVPYKRADEMDLTALEKMRKCSPITYVSSVVAPTLLLIGSKDRRVPSSQAINYYYSLKANNIKTKLLLYEDNHSLRQTPHEMDFLINSVLWFLEHTA
ncbi:acylamino-acid-releasing enzyme-like isoform X2 [Zootermopsis nevadensis]|uniref:acylaminoacyl-peptidase n=1 Tax=Zootermopsis nevadensis TaxID=136037 RepID=A0A067R7F4_ZOONE|nr:acylamino-acid-releasing enzyme-like isoform X2 [Zootermopsis nevadensis]KDR18399.1 Acylamino-acid-releasing enzyme [Zootermopsis nevadensis]